MTPLVKVVARTFTQTMEQLQEGYVKSVAATAGVTAEVRHNDLHKYDLELTRQPDVGLEEVMVRVQMKATTSFSLNAGATHLSYQFRKRADLESLTLPRSIKHILVVMVVPRDQHHWTSSSQRHLKTRQCCYWANLEGMTVSAGVKSPSVQLPLSQKFDASALTGILNRVEKGVKI